MPEGIEYELIVRQEPKQARMCGVGSKADRRPIDPPPVVQLRVIDHRAKDPNNPDNNVEPSSNGTDLTYAQSFLQNPYYFMWASLAKPDDDAELHWLKDGRTGCTTGSVVSSLFHLKDPDNSSEDAGMFIFSDLSVRTEGSYRLKLSLFEVIGSSVRHCKSIYTAPFYVYTAKKFPGMEESTPLSVSLAEQGVKIRIRKDIRVRKRLGPAVPVPLGAPGMAPSSSSQPLALPAPTIHSNPMSGGPSKDDAGNDDSTPSEKDKDSKDSTMHLPLPGVPNLPNLQSLQNLPPPTQGSGGFYENGQPIPLNEQQGLPHPGLPHPTSFNQNAGYAYPPPGMPYGAPDHSRLPPPPGTFAGPPPSHPLPHGPGYGYGLPIGAYAAGPGLPPPQNPAPSSFPEPPVGNRQDSSSNVIAQEEREDDQNRPKAGDNERFNMPLSSEDENDNEGDDDFEPEDDSDDSYREDSGRRSRTSKARSSKASKSKTAKSGKNDKTDKREKKRRKLNPTDDQPTEDATVSSTQESQGAQPRAATVQSQYQPQPSIPHPNPQQQMYSANGHLPMMPPGPPYNNPAQYGGYYPPPPIQQQQTVYGYDQQGYYGPQPGMYGGYNPQGAQGMYYPARPPPTGFGDMTMHPSYAPPPQFAAGPMHNGYGGMPPLPPPQAGGWSYHPPAHGDWQQYYHGNNAPAGQPATPNSAPGPTPAPPSANTNGNQVQAPSSANSTVAGTRPDNSNRANFPVTATPHYPQSQPTVPPPGQVGYPHVPPQQQPYLNYEYHGHPPSGAGAYMGYPQQTPTQNNAPAGGTGATTPNEPWGWQQNPASSTPTQSAEYNQGAYPARHPQHPAYMAPSAGANSPSNYPSAAATSSTDRIQLAPLRTDSNPGANPSGGSGVAGSSTSPLSSFGSPGKERDRRESVGSISSLRNGASAAGHDRYASHRDAHLDQRSQQTGGMSLTMVGRKWPSEGEDTNGDGHRGSMTGISFARSSRDESDRRKNNPLSIGSILDD